MNKLRVGIYLRLSNEDKNKINKNDISESIKNQRNMLIDYINKNIDFKLIDEYCDEDISGAGTYRPEFERLIRDCKNRKLDIVLCKSQSRFSRDMEIVEKYINNKFLEWNIRFISLADNADTSNLGNKKARQINGLINEWYLEDVSNNIKSALLSKMRQGEFISPFASFGYDISKKNNNKLIIDPYASYIVKEIYNLYLKGYGYTKIAKHLNTKNIPSPSHLKYKKGIKLNIVSNQTPDKIKWSSNAIKKILTNELYIGNLIQGKRTTISYKNHKIIKKDKNKWIKIKNTHEAIIDEDTFKKVQKIIKEKNKPLKSNNIHIFSGKVFCLECKAYMRKKNSSKHEYLVCSNSQNEYNNCQNKSSIRYDILNNIILGEINKKINKYFNFEIIKEELIKKEKNKFINKISFLNEQKKDLENKILKTNNYLKNLYENKINNLLTNEEFKDLINNYNKDKIDLNNKLELLNKEINSYEEIFDNYQDLINKYCYFKKLNKVIIDEFINKIYVGMFNKINNERIIKIEWNF